MQRVFADFCGLARVALGAVAVAVAAVRVLPCPAHAYEDQASVDLAAGYGYATSHLRAPQVPSVDLGAARGLGQAWQARGSVGFGAWLGDGAFHPMGRLRAEALYAIDVLALVPALGLGVSMALASGLEPHQRVTVIGGPHAVLSFDYLASRTLIVGLDVREQLLWSLSKPSFLSEAQLRISYLFDMFRAQN